MAKFCTTTKLFVTLGILVIVAVGMLVAVGFLAADEIKGHPPRTTTPPPYITPNPEDPCDISLKDLRRLSESLVSRDVNNMASKITVKHNSSKLLEVPASAMVGPTISALQPLYDNYKAPDGEQEDSEDQQQKAEKDAFLDAIMETSIMQFTELWMKDRCLLNNTDLRSVLDKIWFSRYAGSHSNGVVDSSGFEHTFLGQLMKDHVLGFNNWIYYYHEQQAGTVTYKEGGYINSTQIGEGDSNKGEIVKLEFLWHDLPMSSGVMFIGTSPELELALYTVCFNVMPGKHCPLQMKKQRFELLTMDYQHKGFISVARPIMN